MILGVPLSVVGLLALFAATVGAIGYLSLPADEPDPPPDPRPVRSHIVIVDHRPTPPPFFDWSEFDDL